MSEDPGHDAAELEPDEGLEDEVSSFDLLEGEGLEPSMLEDVVQYTLDWSVQSLLERIGSSFDINPAFQRRDAWTSSRKSLYIESLMLGLPVPQIVLAEDANTKGQFIVLDGKQRLIALKQFAAPAGSFEPLRLRRLEFLHDLEGLTYEDMTSSLLGRPWTDSLLAQPVRTIVVRNWRDPAVLYQIFVRLNQNSVALSPQELRQGLFPGAFMSWVDERSRNSEAIHAARRIRGEDFRMRDAEMLLRYLAFSRDLEKYNGNLRAFLDSACRSYNERWDQISSDLESEASALESAVLELMRIFEDDAFRRYTEGKYIRRFNIAVFDVMSLVFVSAGLGEGSLDTLAAESVRAEYERLCSEDSWFQESLISSTKTPRNTFGRIALWGEALEQILQTGIPIAARARAVVDSL